MDQAAFQRTQQQRFRNTCELMLTNYQYHWTNRSNCFPSASLLQVMLQRVEFSTLLWENDINSVALMCCMFYLACKEHICKWKVKRFYTDTNVAQNSAFSQDWLFEFAHSPRVKSQCLCFICLDVFYFSAETAAKVWVNVLFKSLFFTI